MSPLRSRAVDGVAAALVLTASYALKRFYSAAEPEDLVWILGPTTALLEVATGSEFFFESHVGFVSRELAVAVVPACAGLNFAIIAFAMLALVFVSAHETAAAKAGWLLASAAAAFAFTVFVNAGRIGFGLALRRWTAGSTIASGEQWHRLEGVVVYLTALIAAFAAAELLHAQRRPA